MASGGGGGSLGHRQLWLCEMCEQQHDAFTCKADAAALCYACDATNPLASKHQRFPVSPFLNQLDSTTTNNRNNAASSLLFMASDVDDDDEAKGHGEVLADGCPLWLHPSNHNPKPRNLFSDVEQYLDLDYTASMYLGLHPEMDSVVPVKNRSAPAPPPPPPPPVVTESCKPYGVHLSEAVVAGNESSSTQVEAVVAVGVDREARVMRYREKRKNRRFGKTIRYASRKAYAESRPRVKGRFVKREESIGGLCDDEGELYPERSSSRASATALMLGSGFGVVPSY